MDEKRFLELFPKPDHHGTWKKRKNREEESWKKMEEDEQKKQIQREEFFAHIKAQIQPNKPWEMPENAESVYQGKQKKRQTFVIIKKIMIYTATAAACLILVIVLPNLSNLLNMSNQQETAEQEVMDDSVNTKELIDIFNQKTNEEKENGGNEENKEDDLEKSNGKIQTDNKETKKKTEDEQSKSSSSGFKEEDKDSNNANDQKQTSKQEVKTLEEKGEITDKPDKDSKNTDKGNKKTDKLIDSDTEQDSLAQESAIEEKDSSVPESAIGEDNSAPESAMEDDIPTPESAFEEDINIPTIETPASFPAASEVTTTIAEEENMENEMPTGTNNIETDSIQESVDSIVTEDTAATANTLGNNNSDSSSALEYALRKGEKNDVSLETQKELAKTEVEQELKTYPYLSYDKEDNKVWYEPIQETKEAVDEKELLGTAFIFKEKTATVNTGIRVSVYGNKKDLSTVFIRFFSEGNYWYYSYQVCQ